MIRSLDDLFADSMQAQTKAKQHTERVIRNAKPETEKRITTSERYSLPEFWVKGRTIAIVHEPSRTALGTFQEFCHKREAGARKLVRVEGACAIAGIEYVQDDAWLGLRKEEIALEPQSWTSERTLVLQDLLLEAFGVHKEGVEVSVKIKFGGIYRVDLTRHETFHSPDASLALTLPAGTNVLEVMGLEAKIALRKELA